MTKGNGLIRKLSWKCAHLEMQFQTEYYIHNIFFNFFFFRSCFLVFNSTPFSFFIFPIAPRSSNYIYVYMFSSLHIAGNHNSAEMEERLSMYRDWDVILSKRDEIADRLSRLLLINSVKELAEEVKR